jgi:hypothetical protein
MPAVHDLVSLKRNFSRLGWIKIGVTHCTL